MTDDAALRVSDADREGAALALRDAAADGRLTLDELTKRLDGAYGAKTRDDLDRVLHDLQARAAPQPPSTRPRRRWLLAVMGGTDLRGRFRVEDGLRVVAVMGGANIDLRQAELTRPELTITVFSLMGGVNVVVPPGVEVDGHSVFAIMGGRHIRVPDDYVPGAPRIRVRGLAVMGGLNVSAKGGRPRGLLPPGLPPLP